jgi:hypothetical protein
MFSLSILGSPADSHFTNCLTNFMTYLPLACIVLTALLKNKKSFCIIFRFLPDFFPNPVSEKKEFWYVMFRCNHPSSPVDLEDTHFLAFFMTYAYSLLSTFIIHLFTFRSTNRSLHIPAHHSEHPHSSSIFWHTLKMLSTTFINCMHPNKRECFSSIFRVRKGSHWNCVKEIVYCRNSPPIDLTAKAM